MISWRNSCIFTLLLIGIGLPTAALATGYVELVGIPRIGGETAPIRSTEDYINVLLNLSIGLAAFVAVVKLVLAGVKYALSEIVTDKGEAKKDIQGAILGLLLIIGSVTILTEINPNLKVISFLRNIPTPVLSPVPNSNNDKNCIARSSTSDCILRKDQTRKADEENPTIDTTKAVVRFTVTQEQLLELVSNGSNLDAFLREKQAEANREHCENKGTGFAIKPGLGKSGIGDYVIACSN